MKRAYDDEMYDDPPKTPYKKQKKVHIEQVTTRLVLNKCFGGFGLSEKGKQRLMQLLGYHTYDARHVADVLDNIPRHHPSLVQVIEELGMEAWVPLYDNEYLHRPMIVDVPVDQNEYEIIYKDGWECALPKQFETIHDPNRDHTKKMRPSENDCPRNSMYQSC